MAYACPDCGGKKIETTTAGYLLGRDMNEASCECGWTGFGYETHEPTEPADGAVHL